MASSPITSWQMDGKTMETVIDFIYLGSKITADNDCSHEIKRCLEELPHFQGPVAAWVQEGLEELLHPEGQEGWQ